jgi:hypothetical protein
MSLDHAMSYLRSSACRLAAAPLCVPDITACAEGAGALLEVLLRAAVACRSGLLDGRIGKLLADISDGPFLRHCGIRWKGTCRPSCRLRSRYWLGGAAPQGSHND